MSENQNNMRLRCGFCKEILKVRFGTTLGTVRIFPCGCLNKQKGNDNAIHEKNKKN